MRDFVIIINKFKCVIQIETDQNGFIAHISPLTIVQWFSCVVNQNLIILMLY